MAGQRKRERAKSAFDELQSNVEALEAKVEHYRIQRQLLRVTHLPAVQARS